MHNGDNHFQVELIPLVTEANDLAILMDKPYQFEICIRKREEGRLYLNQGKVQYIPLE